MDIEIRDPQSIVERFINSEFEHSYLHFLNKQSYLFTFNKIFGRKTVINRVKRKIQVFPHQIETALRVLNELGHRAILADEVGLGKTIEAGIIIKEYVARKMAEKILILTPAPLVKQWQGEMEEKFDLIFKTPLDSDFSGFYLEDMIISSIDTAKQPHNSSVILSKPWDAVVVDEAHKLRNSATLAYRFVFNIPKKYFLLLTATPVQNSLDDLYNLVNLLKPGILSTKADFYRNFVADKKGRKLKNPEKLKGILKGVMIRNRRKDVGINFTKRFVETYSFLPTEKEKKLHDSLIDYISEEYTRLQAFDGKTNRAMPGKSVKRMKKITDTFRLMLMERELASSPFALRNTLKKFYDEETEPHRRATLDELYEQCCEIGEVTKAKNLEKILETTGYDAIVFTQFVATQSFLEEYLDGKGFNIHIFNGKMSSAEKEAVISGFKRGGGVLISTDSGSEGRNLQFCNFLINYDLPWNPMRVEQRIGRVHRIGQKKDVYIINFTLKETIEEYILRTLYEKIDLARVAVGEMDLILSNTKTARNIERAIFELSLKIKNKKEFEQERKQIFIDIEKAKDAAEKIKLFDQEVLKNFDLSYIQGS